MKHPSIHHGAVWLFAAALAALAQPASANNYTVGSDAACGYATIQAAVEAAAAHAGADTVSIATNATYANQAITIGDSDDIDIEGGFSDCSQTAPSSPYLSITGNDSDSIFTISGSGNVKLGHLEIQGNTVSGDGGGILYTGSGSLTLVDTWVDGNSALDGGGIAMLPRAAATLVLQGSLDGSIISGNAAQSGGGIYAGPHTTIYANSITWISANTASDSGAGLYIFGDDTASATAYLSGSVGANIAANYGGGLYAKHGATVSLYTTDAANPAQLWANTANAAGGAVFLDSAGLAPADGTTTLCAQDFSIDDNIAPNGMAIYSNGHDTIKLNPWGESCAAPSPPIAMTPVTCGAESDRCNEVADNRAQAGDGSATQGFVFWLNKQDGGGANFEGIRFAARRNSGGGVLYLDTSIENARALLANCLMADNTLAHNDVWAPYGNLSGTEIDIDNCTFANNHLAGGLSIWTDVATLYIYGSIFADDPDAGYDWAYGSNNPSFVTLTAAYDLFGSGTDTSLSGMGVMQGLPSFVDAANGDYHLLPTSLGVDYAPANQTGTVDLDGNPRNRDLAAIPNLYGPLDLGAYETQSGCKVADTVFCNGFDDD